MYAPHDDDVKALFDSDMPNLSFLKQKKKSTTRGLNSVISMSDIIERIRA